MIIGVYEFGRPVPYLFQAPSHVLQPCRVQRGLLVIKTGDELVGQHDSLIWIKGEPGADQFGHLWSHIPNV